MKKQSKQFPRSSIPKTIEREYLTAIRLIIKPTLESVKNNLVMAIPEIVARYRSEVRTDSKRYDNTYGELISKIFGNIKIDYLREYNPEPTINSIADKIQKNHKAQYDRQMKTVLGINPVLNQPYLESQSKSFIKTNVNLITSIIEDYLGGLETMVRSNVDNGSSASSLQREILNTFSFRKTEPTKASSTGVRRINPVKRAKLIARDQVASFFGNLSETRQLETGVKKFKWLTSKDSRVRDDHRRLEGKIFLWSSLPKNKNGQQIKPGSEINCRCVATPVFE